MLSRKTVNGTISAPIDESISSKRPRYVHRRRQFPLPNKPIAFIDMLNSMRHGQIDGQTAAQFYKLSRPIQYSDGLDPCELYVLCFREINRCIAYLTSSFPLREQVHEANQTKLRRIIGTPHPYEAIDVAGHDIRNNQISIVQAKKLLDRLIAPETIELKVKSV